MLRSRLIPCLLVHKDGLVKTQNFKDPKYVGDPINAVRIFNEKEVDELIVLDIDASVQQRAPNFQMIENLAAECRMPLCYGGGVTTADQAAHIIGLGVEKVAVSSAAITKPSLISAMAQAVGSQSVVAVLDVRKSLLGRYTIYTHNGKRSAKADPVDTARQFQDLGAGEIVINSIDNDGRMAGYDLQLAARMRDAVDLPMTVLGGAGQLSDIEALTAKFGIVGAAAGSLFVFKGKYRAVLINYPVGNEKSQALGIPS